MKKYVCTAALVLSSVVFAWSQETQIRGFWDAQYGIVKADSAKDSKSNHGFATGQFDLFITSQINDHISFLGETVFEWDPEVGDWALDVERVIVKYAVKDYFNIAGGKFHTPFGYWNNAYHHGSVIQPTINRPVIVRFEDNGGFLPIHQVGLQVSGTAITRHNISYNVFVSNGQAQGNTGGTVNYSGQAISGNLSVEPIEGLQFIASAYTASVPKNSLTYQGIVLPEASRYTLVNGGIVYFQPTAPVEFAVEYYNIANKMTTTNHTNAMYAYVGLPVSKKLVPYALYNNVTFQSTESYFINNNLHEISLGARYVLHPKAVLKVEYTHAYSELYKSSSLIQTQFAIGF